MKVMLGCSSLLNVYLGVNLCLPLCISDNVHEMLADT